MKRPKSRHTLTITEPGTYHGLELDHVALLVRTPNVTFSRCRVSGSGLTRWGRLVEKFRLKWVTR